MKKIFLALVTCLFVVSIAGCGSDNKDTTSTKSDSKSSSSSNNDKSYLDYINKIEVGDSLDQINEVIGSEGEVHSDNATYSWDIGNGGFIAVFREDDTTSALSVEVSYDKKDVENKKVKISDLDSLKSKVGEGISYDDFKENLGGADGVLVSKGPVTKSYVWRSPDGSVVDGAFRLDDNMCNSFTGTER